MTPACSRRPARAAFTILELLIVIGIVAVLAAISVPSSCGNRRGANVRACYANQKTIAGAIEMYNLDFNTQVMTLDPVFMKAKLQTNGYLQSVPRDPGQGKAPGENYRLRLGLGDLGGKVTCAHHGPIQGSLDGSGTGRELEKLVGTRRLVGYLRRHRAHTDALILAQAMEQTLDRQRQTGFTAGRQEGWLQGALGASFLFFIAWLRGLYRMRFAPVVPMVVAPALDPSEIRILAASPGLFTASADPSTLPKWTTPATIPAGKCPVCSDHFYAGASPKAQVLDCPRCDTPHHRECRDFLRGCAIYGCDGGGS